MSELWQRKMRTFFHLLDFDSDGLISKRDFERIADGFCASEKVGCVERQEKLRKFMVDIWLIFMSSAKSDENRYLTETLLIDSLKKQRNNPKLRANLQDLCRFQIEAMDANQDGYLQFEECRRAYISWGLRDTSFAEKTFKALDTDQDGKISAEEYVHAFLEFMFSEDIHSRYNLFLGNLK